MGAPPAGVSQEEWDAAVADVLHKIVSHIDSSGPDNEAERWIAWKLHQND